jgi:hypothetical protein
MPDTGTDDICGEVIFLEMDFMISRDRFWPSAICSGVISSVVVDIQQCYLGSQEVVRMKRAHSSSGLQGRHPTLLGGVR